MRSKNEKYSDHFWASEFDYIEPENILLTVLERLRVKTKDSIILNSSARTIKKHIAVYKNLESKGRLGDKKWYQVIPWKSRHLPVFNRKLRAVDFKAVKARDSKGHILSHYTGDDLHDLLKEIEDEMSIFLGIGVGDYYCHVDIDREAPTVWYYK